MSNHLKFGDLTQGTRDKFIEAGDAVMKSGTELRKRTADFDSALDLSMGAKGSDQVALIRETGHRLSSLGTAVFQLNRDLYHFADVVELAHAEGEASKKEQVAA